MIKCTTDKKREQTHCEIDGYMQDVIEELYGAVQTVTNEMAKTVVEDEEGLKEEKEYALMDFIMTLLSMNDLSLGDLVNYAVSEAFDNGIDSALDVDYEDEDDQTDPFHLLS